jgi:hypothetical protein
MPKVASEGALSSHVGKHLNIASLSGFERSQWMLDVSGGCWPLRHYRYGVRDVVEHCAAPCCVALRCILLF